MNRKEVAIRFFDALNAGDVETVLSCLDSGVELVTPERTFHGTEEIREEFGSGRPPGDFEHVEASVVDRKLEEEGDVITSTATRVMRWKESGEVASEDVRHARLTFSGDKIVKIEPLWKPDFEEADSPRTP